MLQESSYKIFQPYSIRLDTDLNADEIIARIDINAMISSPHHKNNNNVFLEYNFVNQENHFFFLEVKCKNLSNMNKTPSTDVVRQF